MFFRIQWSPSTKAWNESAGPLLLHTSLGVGTGLVLGGEQGGGLAVVFEPISQELVSFVRGASYVQAIDYSGLALLSEWLAEIDSTLPESPAFVQLSVSAMPSVLLASGERVSTFIRNLGFEVTLDGRTLHIAKTTTPRTAARELSVILYALDHQGRAYVGEEIRDEMRGLCLERFARSQEFPRLMQLMSETQGPGALDRLLARTEGQGRRGIVRSNSTADTSSSLSLLNGFTVETGKKIQIARSQVEPMLDRFLRFSVDPRWLIYLPPAMASAQCLKGDYLERPEDGFSYYRNAGVMKVVVEYKHMGSRAVVIVCQGREVAARRFGFNVEQNPGCVYTRNGRPFFNEAAEETSFLEGLQSNLSKQGFWKRWGTDWVLFDGEILPWSLKAERLIELRHGEVLATGRGSIQTAILGFAGLEGADSIRATLKERLQCFENYARLYDRYSVERGKPLEFAPFQLLASEGRTYFDKNHLWHMEVLGGMSRRGSGVFRPTPFQVVDVHDEEECARAVKWWEQITKELEEGVVIKPLPIVAKGRRGGSVQPGIKCRGREHLRLVYGPEYDRRDNIAALRERAALMHRRQKHRRIAGQFELSVEGVKRFVRREPVERVEECVVAIAALERAPSE